MSPGQLYRALLRLLPASVSAEDRDSTAATFEEVCRDASGWRRRARVLLVAFGRLPGVIALEWLDYWITLRAPARRKGDGMDGTWNAMRLATRSLARNPAFAWSVVLLLGLGVGATTTIFSVVDHVVLRPLPYPDADRLVEVQAGDHSGPTFERLSGMATLESLAGIFTDDATLTGGEEPLRLREAQVTRDFFPLLGARPAVGRLPVPADGEANGVVFSHGTWVRLFGEDEGVVGRTVRLNGVPRVVIGVLDADFVPPEALGGGDVDVWRPLDWDHEYFQTDNFSVLAIAGRLASGVTIEEAQAEVDALTVRRAEEAPTQFRLNDGRAVPLPLVSLQDATVGNVRRGLGLIFGAVALLLLVACANVALLFMARAVERTREMSVRRALGAGRSALARQVGVESAVLGLAGAAGGAALAWAAVRAFRAFGAGTLPRMDAISVDGRVLGFAVLVGVSTALVFGLVPALRIGAVGGDNPLHPSSRGSTPTRGTQAMRHGLVIGEVALSLILAAQAGWLVRGFSDLHAVELGFRTENVWTLPLTLGEMESPEAWYRRAEGIRESLESVPGVRSASYSLSMPLQHVGGNHCCWRTTVDFGEYGTLRRITAHPVDAAYFELLDLRVETGRTWSRAEASGSERPAVITEPLAVEAFGAADRAPGHAVTLGGVTYSIVGVVADHRHYGPDRTHSAAAVFVPAGALGFAPQRVHMAVLTNGGSGGLARSLAEAVWRVQPDLPVPIVRSMDDWATAATARLRFISSLFSAFGAVALLLVSGGLAGTLLYTVRVRRRELGIRLTLGASPGRVEGSVLRRGLAMTFAGVVLGTVGAWMSGRFLEGIVAGIETRDLTTFAMSAAVLLGVALVSSWLPARRAAKTDPMETLRVE